MQPSQNRKINAQYSHTITQPYAHAIASSKAPSSCFSRITSIRSTFKSSRSFSSIASHHLDLSALPERLNTSLRMAELKMLYHGFLSNMNSPSCFRSLILSDFCFTTIPLPTGLFACLVCTAWLSVLPGFSQDAAALYIEGE